MLLQMCSRCETLCAVTHDMANEAGRDKRIGLILRNVYEPGSVKATVFGRVAIGRA